MDAYSKALRKRLVKTRLTGIVAGALAAMCIVFFVLELMNPWICAIVLSYSMGLSCVLNSMQQDIRDAKRWKSFSQFLSVIFFLATIALVVYAFVSGEIRF